MPATHLALLRGINVGGKNILPMSDLRDLFSEAGCHDVRTYIQSGNVLFRAERRRCTSSSSRSSRMPAASPTSIPTARPPTRSSCAIRKSICIFPMVRGERN
ncbi:MAG: DUF1697 domain-containing protein [Thermomicrobia bacterium]|nr:DUF1697 domain-containing protein [Thermomicrobia bacterium]